MGATLWPILGHKLCRGRSPASRTSLGSSGAAVVVEDRYSQVFKLDRVRPAVIADALAEATVRYPMVPIVFCETARRSQEVPPHMARTTVLLNGILLRHEAFLVDVPRPPQATWVLTPGQSPTSGESSWLKRR